MTDEQMEEISQKGVEQRKMVIHVMDLDSHTWRTIPSQEYITKYIIPGPCHTVASRCVMTWRSVA